MEKLPTVKQEKRSLKSSPKKPVKVVYISNPLKIKATPSDFREVVQQLTGRYATSSPLHERTGIANKGNDEQEQEQEQEQEEQAGCGKWKRFRASIDAPRCTTRSDLSYEPGCPENQVMDDLIITPQMFEGFSPLLNSDFGS